MNAKKEFHFKSEKKEEGNNSIVQKYSTFIVLLLIDMFEREQAEELKAKTFNSWNEFWDYIKKLNIDADLDNVVTYSLDEYIQYCNDETLTNVDNWLTFINIADENSIPEKELIENNNTIIDNVTDFAPDTDLEYTPDTDLECTEGFNINSFKKSMIIDFIPFIENLIIKEENHLSWLKKKNAQNEFIIASTNNLNHLKQRHKEYIEYVQKKNINNIDDFN